MKVVLPLLQKCLLCLLLFPLQLFSQDNALLFDDSDDNITFVTSQPFALNMTFEAWINPSTTAGFQTIAAWTNGSSEARLSLANGFLSVFEDDGGGMTGSITGSIEVSANEWTHIAMVRTGGSTDFYVNGVVESEGFNVASGGGNTFTLGIFGGSFNAFGGLMDEVRIWDTSLTGVTIQNQMFTALTGSEGNLVAYYQFNETTGTTLPDLSPSGHDGTLVNFPGPTDPSWQPSTALTEVFTVTTALDDFAGSLRQAIVSANASTADNVLIDFDIAGGGPWTIPLVTDLPAITRDMTIDGRTQTGWNFSTENMVTLDLSGVTNGDGFNVLSIDVSIIGMKIDDAEFGILVNGDPYDNVRIQENIFSSNNNISINIVNGDNVTIVGNHIGVSGDGLTGSTGSTGIAISGCLGATIGGDRLAGDGNMIAASVFSSYLINIAGSQNIVIEGNIIGASTNGNDITTSRGVLINTTDNVTVGSSNADRRNYIAGIDATAGLSVSNGDQVDILNNYFGIGIVDSHTIGNSSGNSIPGITSSNGLTNFTIDGNVLSGADQGISLGGNSNTGSILNNLIGVRPDGTTAFANTTHGINLTGSLLSGITVGGGGDENIIAYNNIGIRRDQTSYGTIEIAENSIFCNTAIGIDIAGTPVVAAPVITSVSATEISGTTTAEDNVNILIYESDDACNSDQGATFVVEGFDVASGGNWTVSGSFSPGMTFTAVVIDDETAVDAVFGSSEFSTPFSTDLFTVTNVADAGVGSLRQAIIDANASTADQVFVHFGIIGGGGPWTIPLASGLPAITRSMIIDGSTQPTFDMDAGLMVELDGTSAGNANGFVVQSADVEIYGMHIDNMQGNNGSTGVGVYISGETYDNFVIGGPNRGNVISDGRYGISISSADAGIIQGNRIGTDMAGTTADGNTFNGILMSGSDGTLIGGNSTIGEGNVISNNALGTSGEYGLEISTSDNVNVYGNLIGTDKDGENDFGNLRGVQIAVGSDFVNFGNTGTGEGNVVSGNNGTAGVLIAGGTNVIVNNNIIGLNSAGDASIANGGDGVRIITDGAGMAIRNNVISASTGDGIDIDGVQSALIVEDNYIGTDVNGDAGAGHGNLAHGVSFRNSNGLDNTAQRIVIRNNVISGNGTNVTDNGINFSINNFNVLIQDNLIGVEQDGTTALGNLGQGIEFSSGTTAITVGGAGNENTIANSGGAGIQFLSVSNSQTNVIDINSIHCNTDGAISYTITPDVDRAEIDGLSASAIFGTSTAPENSVVRVYESTDGCNNDEAFNYLGFTTVQADGTWTYSSALNTTLAHSVQVIEDGTGHTSQFSAATLFEVTTTADPGAGSLREAITNANLVGSSVNLPFVGFNLAGDGSGSTWTISLANASGPLPDITRDLIIDGTTQSGWDIDTDRLIVIDGATNSITGTGLNCTAGGVEFYGLKITGFTDDGISLFGGTGGAVIGDAGKGNVINNNGNRGVEITLLDDVILKGNRIGTDYSGTSAAPNGTGISILTSASSIIVGGPDTGEGNLISGNTNDGIGGNAAGGHTIENNIIGLNISHNTAIPNGGDGIELTTSGTNTISNNILGGNGGAGISLSGSNQTIIGNTIGTDLTGTLMLGNGVGIQAANTGNFDDWQIGTGNPGEGNVIAFNSGAAVLFIDASQTGHMISENSIYSNGLGINLSGVANTNLSAPNITGVTESDVTVDGVANGDLVEVFISDGQGQGQTFIGSATSTGTTVTVGSLSQTILSAQRVVTTRIDGSNNTSQFSTEFLNYPILAGSGNSIVLDGVDDEVNLGTYDFSGVNELSVEAWIKPSYLPAGPSNETATIIGMGFLEESGTSTFGLFLRGDDTGNSELRALIDNNSTTEVAAYDAFNLNTNQWVHVAMTWASGNPVNLYVNGINVASSAALAGPINYSGDNIVIGNSFNGDEIRFEGEIDELRIWNAELTQSAIRDFVVEEFVSGGDHPNDGDIVSYYRFDESGGTSLGDLVGSNSGTIDGGASFTTSGAHIGDESAHTTTTSVALGGGAASGNNLTVNNIQGSPDITYLYRVNEAPNNTSVALGLSTLNTTDYYGVFQSGGINPMFNAQWFYANNTAVSGSPGENGIRFMRRRNAADGVFDEFSSNILDVDSTLNIVIDQNVRSGEFAQGYTNPYRAPTPPGNALDFDGVNDVVDLGTDLESVFAGPSKSFTIEAWINPETFTGANRKVILSKNGNSNCAVDERQFTFVASLDEGLRFIYYGANDLSLWRAFEGGTIHQGTWQHVAVTYDGSINTGDGADRVQFYVNGILQSTNAGGGAGAFPFDISSGPSHVGLGGTLNSTGTLCENPDNVFDGSMDEVRVWDTVLSGATINAQAFSTVDVTHPNYGNLVSYHRMDDSDGASSTTVLHDLAGTNDGTLLNFPADNSANWITSGAFLPSAPSDLFTTEVSSTQIDLDWSDNSGSETGFTIERSDGNSSSFATLNTVGPGVTTYSDNTVTADNGYFYRVIANAATGDSDPSNEKFGSTIHQPGNALDLDGNDDYVEINSLAQVMAGNESAMTIEFWTKASDIHSGTTWSNFFGVHNTSGDNIFLIHIGAASVSIDNQIGITDGITGPEVVGPVIGDNTWHHVAYTRDGTIGTLYVDGVSVLTHTADFVLSTDDYWSLGTDIDPGIVYNDFLDAELDEVRIWSTVRTEPEIHGARFSTLIGNEPGLLAYYRFDQDESTDLLVPDRSTNNHNGTWSGSGSGVTTPVWPVSDAFAPEEPTALIATEVSSTRIDLSWQDNSTLETDFVIERSDSNLSSFVQIGTSEADAPSYVDNSVTAGNGYFYRVKAINGTSSSGYTNTKFGGTITPPGNALQFDGTDDQVNFDSPLLSTYSNFTLEFWARIPVTNTGQVDYFVQEDPAGGGTPQIVLASTLSNSSYMFLRETNGGATALVQGTTILNDDTWHHIAFVRDGTSLLAYIDGQLEGSSTVFAGDIVFPATATSRLEGDAILDEFKLWDVALTQSEIQNGLGTVSIGNEANLISYYRFDQDETTDLHLPDRSNANNNGTWTDSGGSTTTPQWVGSDAFRIKGIVPKDYIALVELYNDTDGANWTNNTNWLSASLVSTWNGVTVVGDRVTQIQLPNNNLSGTIPSELQHLDALVILDLGSNTLIGSIPPELGTLVNLTDLILFDNQLSGSIPTEIGDLSNLQDLELDVNQLTGAIPAELGNLSNLQDLELDANMLSGSIPTNLGNLTSLNLMTLDDNQLTGSIPIELGNLTTLTDLRLHENQLTGAIPAEIGNLTLLDNLELDRNMLSGSIPTGIGNLVNLQYLSLFTNNLTGSIPTEIESLTNLQHLDFSHNMLSGSIPTEMGMLTALTHLELDDNQLTGPIPTEIGSLVLLDDLQLDINQFTGSVPSNFTALTNLTNLELSENMLTDLPDLSSITGLAALLLQSNSFEFDDLEPNVAVSGVAYSPQANVSAPANQSLNEGDDLNVSLTVGGTSNQYQWFKDGAVLAGQTSNSLSIAGVAPADAGDYHLEVTNTVASGLTISSDPFTLDVDGIPTVITQDVSVSLDATGNATITPATVDSGSSDDVSATGDLILSLDINTFDCTNLGTNTVMLTVTDEAGNSASASATVTVQDDTSPTASTQNISVTLDASGNATIVAGDVDNGSTDNCSMNLSLDVTTFDCTDLGSNTVTLTVTDDAGNSTNATATVTVQDSSPPIAIAQDISVTLDATGNATIAAGDIDNGSTDNCSVNLSLDVTTFDCTDIDANTVTLTVTDDAGNSANATSTVTIQDTAAPTAVTQDITVALDASGNATIAAGDVDNGSTDNCSVSLSLDVTTFDCTDLGANTVTLTAADDAGNSTNATATVTVQDTSPPIVITQNITISLDATGNVTIAAGDIDDGSTDNCSVNLSLDVTTFDCTDVGTNTVTLTATDDAGNSASATAIVTVQDTSPPIVITQNITATLDATGNVIIAAGDVDNGSNDNCLVNLSLDVTTFDCTDVGTNTVTLTATDDAGNSTNATAEVTIVDDLSPTVLTQDVTVTLNSEGLGSITTGEIDNGTSDNCTFTLSLDVTDFTSADIGVNTVTLTATDAAGNSSSTTAEVTVESGNLPPDFFFTYFLEENSPNGKLIGTVVATDPEGDPLTYTILSGNTGDAFAIGSGTGDLTVNTTEALDFETTPTFDLVVQADDGNGGVSMVSITINLLDVDEEMVTAIDDLTEISIFPNPVQGTLFIEMDGFRIEEVTVTMYTVSGSQVLNSGMITKQRNMLELDLQNLSSGIYLLKIQHRESLITKNVFVK